jgi:transposase
LGHEVADQCGDLVEGASQEEVTSVEEVDVRAGQVGGEGLGAGVGREEPCATLVVIRLAEWELLGLRFGMIVMRPVSVCLRSWGWFWVSMEPQPWPEPAAEIVRAVQAKYRGRQVPLPVAVRDRFGELFTDAEFAGAFAVTGPRGWSPGRLALVTVFQMAENLTDRQAAQAVRDRLSWAYALGLDLADAGFDHSVLSEFRSRVVAHRLEEKVLDLLLTRLKEMGLVGAGGRLSPENSAADNGPRSGYCNP